jgi:hypothetical protein
MPPFTTPSTFNAISSRARRSGSSEPRRRINGEMRLPQRNPRIPPGAPFSATEVNLTMPAVVFIPHAVVRADLNYRTEITGVEDNELADLLDKVSEL